MAIFVWFTIYLIQKLILKKIIIDSEQISVTYSGNAVAMIAK